MSAKFGGINPQPSLTHFISAAGAFQQVEAANPLPVAGAPATVVPAGDTVCSNTPTGASAIVAAASATRKEVTFSNAGSVTIYLNNAAAADNTKFPLLAGQPITFSSDNGMAQREWRAYSASAGVLGIILVEA